MANVAIDGKNMVVFVKLPADSNTAWKLVGCQTNASTDSQTNVSETVTKCETFKSIGNDSSSVSCEGVLLKKSSDTSVLDAVQIRQYYNSKSLYDWKIVDQDPAVGDSGNIPVYTCQGYITALQETFPGEEKSTFSYTISVVGEDGIEAAYLTVTT